MAKMRSRQGCGGRGNCSRTAISLSSFRESDLSPLFFLKALATENLLIWAKLWFEAGFHPGRIQMRIHCPRNTFLESKLSLIFLEIQS